MKKTIFIDIDGVLVTNWSLEQPLKFIDDYTYFEPYAQDNVTAINMIIDELAPTLVIHSSRRYQYSEKSFKDIWRINGILFTDIQVLKRYSEIDDKWFDGPNAEKEYDISRYIIMNNLGDKHYLVIEDEKLCVHNLYQVDGNTGLTVADARKIVAALK